MVIIQICARTVVQRSPDMAQQQQIKLYRARVTSIISQVLFSCEEVFETGYLDLISLH
jgi:hypothetical protein